MEKWLILVLGVLLQSNDLYVYGQDLLCNDKLIQNLPDDHLTSSSSRGDPILATSPDRGRLNTTDTLLTNGTTLMGGWSPATDGRNHFIQATFDHMTMINEVLTQGRHQGNGHVTMYKMEYTEDGSTWETVNNDVGVEKIFQGNVDSDSIQANSLDCPIFAKGIRIIPLDWDTHVALRFDVTGCYVDNALTGTTSMPSITSSNSTPSQSKPITSPTLITTMVTTPNPKTTVATVKTTTQPTTLKTTTSSTKRSTTPTTLKTTPSTVRTTPSMQTSTTNAFLPGVPNPFGTTTKRVTTKPVATTTAPFHPGIPDPFGPGQLIG